MARTRKEQWWDRFQALLDEQNEWPSGYTFKFIAPAASLDDLKAVFGHVPVSERASRKGNYTSVTVTMTMHSSDEVVAVYTAASAIEGVIAL